MDVNTGDRVQIAKNGGEMWTVVQVWPNGQITIQGTRANYLGQYAKRTIDPAKVTHHYPKTEA